MVDDVPYSSEMHGFPINSYTHIFVVRFKVLNAVYHLDNVIDIVLTRC